MKTNLQISSYMKSIIIIFAFMNLMPHVVIAQTEKTWDGLSQELTHGKVLVSANKRFLQFEDGTPFFWLGDTAWELFHRLNKEETEMYLENRRAKGFTVIQAVVLAARLSRALGGSGFTRPPEIV